MSGLQAAEPLWVRATQLRTLFGPSSDPLRTLGPAWGIVVRLVPVFPAQGLLGTQLETLDNSYQPTSYSHSATSHAASIALAIAPPAPQTGHLRAELDGRLSRND
jgi:hypothetical protein